MRIAAFEVEPWERPTLERLLGADHDLMLDPGPLDPGAAARVAGVDAVSVFVHSVVDPAVLDRLPGLRMVATRSTGHDHVDLTACRARGVAVANVPAYGERTVAEHVFALILALARHLPEAIDRARGGDFSLHGLVGFDLYEKELAIVGMGAIGRNVARIAAGFGMRVLAVDPAPHPDCSAIPDLTWMALDDALARADIVSLHLPANAATRHLIDARALALMKRGAILINTARGSVVDEAALLTALTVGHLGGAGLDVLPDEPGIREEAELLRAMTADRERLATLLANHVLLRLRNVIVTPHSAFATREAIDRIIETTAANLNAFADGAPINLVTAEHG